MRRHESEAGRFTLVYLRSGAEGDGAEIELTYNWDGDEPYAVGRFFGHLAFAVDDIYATCQRLMDAGVTINRPPRDGHMAFVRSPDLHSVELLQHGDALPPAEPWASMPNTGSGRARRAAARIDSVGRSTTKRSHFKALLRIDTTNPPGNERAAADYIAGVLEKEGIDYRILESEADPRRAWWRASAATGRRPRSWNGHLDVVPADPDFWTHPPFEAVEADGCIWGRGAIDMKNMVTMPLVTMLLAKRSGSRWSGT